MYKIAVFVPCEDLEKVKNAMFLQGAGKIGKYEKCSFQTEGYGQFLPMEGSNPFIGKTGSLEVVKEIKLEMLCEKKYLKSVISQMKKAHPYEECVYEVIKLQN